MLEKLQRFFSPEIPSERTSERDLQLACAGLMMEVATIDQNYDEREHDSLIASLCKAFKLDVTEAAELETLARQYRDKATSLHQFTQHINERASHEQKYRLIQAMWRVAFADGELDKYEEHIIRRASDLIHISHSEFIRAKLSVKGR